MTTQFGASSSSSSSFSTTQSWTHDVFLSFRGEDTRNNFIGHLHNNLVQKGIKPFRDDDGLKRGEDISPALLRAIEESKISVIVFSENYASSKWCLEELAKIIQCKESKQQMVYPVFYKVDPSDVRNQRGSFGQALAHHDNWEKVVRWKKALTKAGNLSGWHLADGGHESDFILKIVEEISQQVLNRSFLNVDKYLVGIESRVEDVYKLLSIGENDVQMVGIWGIGGLGKTTIAKAVYNLIAHKFEGSCFMENVRERSSMYGGLVILQKFLLSNTLGLKELKVSSVDEGVTVIKERLSHKRILLILDDVSALDQLNYLVGKPAWFGSGSRIIITTRDKHWLTVYDVNQIYEVEKLSHHEALEFFIFNAFKENRLLPEFSELINKVILYAQGLPLVLQVLGSYLRGRSIKMWEDVLDYCKRNPKLQEFLKISYDSLEPLVKEVFLHIACFFKGKEYSYVMDILEGCDLPKYGIEVLKEKALIRITESNEIWMHDLLEEMGKEIVCQESQEPGERSRLWLYEDVYHVFAQNTGTNKIKGIMVKGGLQKQICLSIDSFSKLKNLQIFIISSDIFVGDYVEYLSNELRILDWTWSPLSSFPSSFYPKKLVLLKMHKSRTIPFGKARKMLFGLEMPWSSNSPLGNGLKIMQHMKSIDVSYCSALTRIHDFSIFPNLVKLDLTDCVNLVEVDPSVGFLKHLVSLRLCECRGLRKFEISGEMKSLKYLDLGWTGIKELSISIGCLPNLESLTLTGCSALCRVSKLSNILEGKESKMTPRMNLSHCYLLCFYLPRQFAKLKKKNIPEDISEVTALMSIFLSCWQSEFHVEFPGSEIPEWFTCRKVFERFPWPKGVETKGLQVYNLRIEFPRNFKWENKGGLAFCAQGGVSMFQGSVFRFFAIYINGVCIIEESEPLKDPWWGLSPDHVWMYYAPFDTIIKRLSEAGLPPPSTSICVVNFEFEYKTSKTSAIPAEHSHLVKGSCGIHLVMPEVEDEGGFGKTRYVLDIPPRNFYYTCT
ncbi:disease resistance protein RPV1-like [Rosa sericea]